MVKLFDEVLLISTWPPTARLHTPPPGWSGCGLPGALTKAVLCVRKAVFAAATVAAIFAATATDVAVTPAPLLAASVEMVQFCAAATSGVKQSHVKDIMPISAQIALRRLCANAFEWGDLVAFSLLPSAPTGMLSPNSP